LRLSFARVAAAAAAAWKMTDERRTSTYSRDPPAVQSYCNCGQLLRTGTARSRPSLAGSPRGLTDWLDGGRRRCPVGFRSRRRPRGKQSGDDYVPQGAERRKEGRLAAKIATQCRRPLSVIPRGHQIIHTTRQWSSHMKDICPPAPTPSKLS